ncbi:hypothetical protein OF83DRAFT_1127541 [Amylostereum chailletii]|nr:hypothetical protein OF83DRAFT_1127541 [Amylostereum chailletii]
MHTRRISLYTSFPLVSQTISLSESEEQVLGTQSISLARTSFAKLFNATFALPGMKDIPEDAFVPHLICPTSDYGNEGSLLDPDEKPKNIEGDFKGGVEIVFEVDKDRLEELADIAPRCSFILSSTIKLLEQTNDQLEEARARVALLEAQANETQSSSEKACNNKKGRKGRKGKRNGKNPPKSPETADELATTMKKLQEDLALEQSARKKNLEDERKKHKEAMEGVEARHAKELAARDEDIAALKTDLEEVQTLNRELGEVFTSNDQDARDRLTRRVLLDIGHDVIREKVYDLPKSTQWKRWNEFTKRFASMKEFVEETFPICQERKIILSKDALKRIWQPWSKMRKAGNGVAHGSAATRTHFEHAIASCPKNSIDRKAMTEIFEVACKFGYVPAA